MWDVLQLIIKGWKLLWKAVMVVVDNVLAGVLKLIGKLKLKITELIDYALTLAEKLPGSSIAEGLIKSLRGINSQERLASQGMIILGETFAESADEGITAMGRMGAEIDVIKDRIADTFFGGGNTKIVDDWFKEAGDEAEKRTSEIIDKETAARAKAQEAQYQMYLERIRKEEAAEAKRISDIQKKYQTPMEALAAKTQELIDNQMYLSAEQVRNAAAGLKEEFDRLGQKKNTQRFETIDTSRINVAGLTNTTETKVTDPENKKTNVLLNSILQLMTKQDLMVLA
jgi:hypothetical protein